MWICEREENSNASTLRAHFLAYMPYDLLIWISPTVQHQKRVSNTSNLDSRPTLFVVGAETVWSILFRFSSLFSLPIPLPASLPPPMLFAWWIKNDCDLGRVEKERERKALFDETLFVACLHSQLPRHFVVGGEWVSEREWEDRPQSRDFVWPINFMALTFSLDSSTFILSIPLGPVAVTSVTTVPSWQFIWA